MVHESKDVLITDDDPILRGVLAEIFRECGWCVRTASDGFSALAAFRGKVPHLLLSDLNMPGMSGYEFLSVIRRRFPQVRVIAMSGAYSGMEVPEYVAADAFYPKGGSSVAALLAMASRLGVALAADDRHGSAPLWIPAQRASVKDDREVGLSCSECLRSLAFVPIGTKPLEQDVCCPHCHQVMSVLLLWEDSLLPSLVNPCDLVSSFANRGAFARPREPRCLALQVGAR